MKLWAVGKIDQPGNEHSWEFVGVFDSEELAVAACKDEKHFVGPVTLNEADQDPPAYWPDAFYPKAVT